MKYLNPAIDSSYRENNLGQALYRAVMKHRPEIIVEFGVLNGYSTVAMAMALDELGRGKIKAYDLFEDYQYKHSTLEAVKKNIEAYGLGKYVEFKKMDFDEWAKRPEQFDLMHFDISNDGEKIKKLYETVKNNIKTGAVVLFEGGSEERDRVEWMQKYKKEKINGCGVNFKIIEPRFPSISVIK